MTHLHVLPETTLRCGALHAVLSPSAGGRITGLFSETPSGRIDWLQPLSADVRAAGFESTAWPKAGLYPLVPFSNRIRGGRFEWEGRVVQLPLHPGEGHALHGVSQQRAWHLVRHGDDSATLVHEHPAGDAAWPWPYRAEHTVTVQGDAVRLRLVVTNTGDTPAPCGAGLHPYLPIRFAQRVGFTAGTVWPPDAAFLGTAAQPTPAPDDYRQPRAVGEGELTQYYSGWDGQALLQAGNGDSIRFSATGPLRHLVLYRPAGRDFFCLEPVSHVSDAANLSQRADGAAGTGWQTLAPGQALACELELRVAAGPGADADATIA